MVQRLSVFDAVTGKTARGYVCDRCGRTVWVRRENSVSGVCRDCFSVLTPSERSAWGCSR